MAIAASSRKEETVKMELTFSMFSSYPGVGKRKDGVSVGFILWEVLPSA